MNLEELSKTVSHALRHAPEEYDLNLDDEGWVETNLLLKSLGEKNPEWQSLEVEDLQRKRPAKYIYSGGHYGGRFAVKSRSLCPFQNVAPARIITFPCMSKAI